MNCKCIRCLLLLFILPAAFNSIHAQQPGSPPADGFKLFFEKVYLHFDRTYYFPGDDIWFKAYLVNAQSNIPFNTSSNLYVELIDPNAAIIARKIVYLDSVGVGDFQLGDSIAGGTYRVRAYTNWMRNFGTRFIFEKEIQVANLPGLSKSNPAGKKNNPANKKTASSPAFKIQFLPEGGAMVEDVPSVVCFKAEDASGKGVAATGSIISAKGDTVAGFKTVHLGMGSFTFTPKPGNQYKAMVQYGNNEFVETAFPPALPNGFVMNITDADTDNLLVNINSNAATRALYPTDTMTVAARHSGKSYFKQQILLKEGKATVIIPKKDFPAGIAYITLYDEKMHPHCERLVYMEATDPLTVTVITNKNIYRKKEKTTINISVTDAKKQPVKAALSMAVVEEGMDAPPDGNILSHLMLESELSGKIENPSAYFDKNNKERLQQLDLLLRTQGWRSFLWRQIADTTIKISYLPEPGISISGHVTKPSSNKPLGNMHITLFAPGAKGDKIYMTTTNAAGKYYLDGLPLFGNQAVQLNVGDAIGKKIGAIQMDTLYDNPPPVAVNRVYITDTSAAVRSFEDEASKRWTTIKNNQLMNILPGVTVKGTRRTTILRDGSVAINFGYPEYDFNITAKDYKYQTLRDFIVQKVPGALYDEELAGVNFLQNGKRVRPVLIVDKKQDVFGRLDYYSLHMEQINSVYVRHLVGSPAYNTGDVDENIVESDAASPVRAGFRDYFLINLQLKWGDYDQQLSKINVDVTGYYQGRIFYSPNYSSEDTLKEDNRVTIHWEPFIKTDEDGKATISFYNADPKGKIRVDVQGLTVKGIPVVAGTRYEVK